MGVGGCGKFTPSIGASGICGGLGRTGPFLVVALILRASQMNPSTRSKISTGVVGAAVSLDPPARICGDDGIKACSGVLGAGAIRPTSKLHALPGGASSSISNPDTPNAGDNEGCLACAAVKAGGGKTGGGSGGGAAGGGIDAEPDEEAGVIARFLRRKSASSDLLMPNIFDRPDLNSVKEPLQTTLPGLGQAVVDLNRLENGGVINVFRPPSVPRTLVNTSVSLGAREPPCCFAVPLEYKTPRLLVSCS